MNFMTISRLTSRTICVQNCTSVVIAEHRNQSSLLPANRPRLIPQVGNLRLLTADPTGFLIVMTMTVSSLLHSPVAHGLPGIRVVSNIKLTPQVLGTDERQNNDVHVHTGHEDADDFSVVVASLAFSVVGKWEVLAETGLDGRRSRRHKVTQLVGCANDESAESSWR